MYVHTLRGRDLSRGGSRGKRLVFVMFFFSVVFWAYYGLGEASGGAQEPCPHMFGNGGEQNTACSRGLRWNLWLGGGQGGGGGRHRGNLVSGSATGIEKWTSHQVTLLMASSCRCDAQAGLGIFPTPRCMSYRTWPCLRTSTAPLLEIRAVFSTEVSGGY